MSKSDLCETEEEKRGMVVISALGPSNKENEQLKALGRILQDVLKTEIRSVNLFWLMLGDLNAQVEDEEVQNLIIFICWKIYE